MRDSDGKTRDPLPVPHQASIQTIAMPDLLRQEIATAADLIVVKIGSRVLTREDGLLDQHRVATLAEELHELIETGRKVVLVSSGAVVAGMGRLGLQRRPTDLAHLQAVAAVGQSNLVESYDKALARHGRHAAQLLLTTEDMDHRARYLNVRNTLLTLLEYGALPIINENDTVAVDELQNTFGDNDRLAAAVTNLLRAPLLVLLSDVDGLYDGDPNDPRSQVITTVTQIDDSILRLAAPGDSAVGKGGMASKLEAARIATAAGENVIIANGHQKGTLARILAGQPVGTLLVAQGQTVSSRKRWIAFTAQPRGRLLLDDGAVRAVRDPETQPAADWDHRRRRQLPERGRRRHLRSVRPRICPRLDQLQLGRNRPHPRAEDQPAGHHARPQPLRRSRPPR